MSDRMTKVAVWKTSVKTIQLVCMEYLNYIIDHSVIYEKIQCANWNGTEETNSIFNNSHFTIDYSYLFLRFTTK